MELSFEFVREITRGILREMIREFVREINIGIQKEIIREIIRDHMDHQLDQKGPKA